MGVDIDGNGIGEPVPVWTNPIAQAPQLTEGVPVEGGCSDDFSSSHRYWVGQRQRALGLQWQWNHNPVDSAWSLDERRGWLTLHVLPAAGLREARNQLSQKTVGYESQATTRLDCSQLRDGDHAGMLCTGKTLKAVGVCREKGRLHFFVERDGERQLVAPCQRSVVFLRVTINSAANTHQFAISTDGHHFTPAGQPFALRMGYWKGSRVGLFAYTTGTATGGAACFDYFNYTVDR